MSPFSDLHEAFCPEFHFPVLLCWRLLSVSQDTERTGNARALGTLGTDFLCCVWLWDPKFTAGSGTWDPASLWVPLSCELGHILPLPSHIGSYPPYRVHSASGVSGYLACWWQGWWYRRRHVLGEGAGYCIGPSGTAEVEPWAPMQVMWLAHITSTEG